MVVPDLISGAQPDDLNTQEFRRHMGTVSRHSAVFFAGTVFTTVLGYAFKVYLARTLDARALGIYALGMTIVAFLSLFNSLGLPRAALRYVTTYCATEKFDLLRGFLLRSLLWLLILNLLFGSVMLLAGPWITFHLYHTPEIQTYLPLFALLMVAGVFSNFFGQVLGAYKNVAGRTVVANFIGTPAKVILTVALVAAGFGLGGYIERVAMMQEDAVGANETETGILLDAPLDQRMVGGSQVRPFRSDNGPSVRSRNMESPNLSI